MSRTASDTAAFADVVYADQQWVDAEFAEIVATSFGGPPAPPPPAPPRVPPLPGTPPPPSSRRPAPGPGVLPCQLGRQSGRPRGRHRAGQHHGRGPPYGLLRTELVIRAGDREWTATGEPRAWVPLRHRSADENGEAAPLRIVKSPTRWTFGDGRLGADMSEIHDRIGAGGVPAGIHD